MMNEPTNRAITANTIRNTLKKLMSSAICVLLLLGDLVTGEHLDVIGEHRRDLMRRAPVGTTPSSAAMRIASTLPSPVMCRWAAAGVNSATDAPPGLSVPANVTVPTIVTGCGPDWVRTVVESPSAKPPLSKLDTSITTSSSVVGGRPVLERERVEGVVGDPLAAEHGSTHVGVAHRFAVLVDDLGVRLGVALGGPDAVERR